MFVFEARQNHKPVGGWKTTADKLETLLLSYPDKKLATRQASQAQQAVVFYRIHLTFFAKLKRST